MAIKQPTPLPRLLYVIGRFRMVFINFSEENGNDFATTFIRLFFSAQSEAQNTGCISIGE